LNGEFRLTSKFIDWQETQTQSLLTASSEAAFGDALSSAARELGFEYCAFGMRMPLPVSNPKVFMTNNYSADWRSRYAQENYLAVDPTVAHGMKSVLPLVWDDSLFDSARPFWEDARSHGLKVGWAKSCIDAQGAVGMLTLARSNELITPSEMRDNAMRMSWLAQMAHEGMTRVVAASRGPTAEINLTAREIDVLRWTADGKTSGEVGQIMNITERTVNFHINNSLLKLGAVNKTAGVIKAAMLRLL
jgi:LuxR family transcriptional regulator, quorum-sensing system regulator SolR